MTQPRPILKRSPASAPRHVHFPPSPVLARTFAAHSPTAYDRSPIVVAPNACALPARGCPGRTYLPPDTALPIRGQHAHPRAPSMSASKQPVPGNSDGGPSVDDPRPFPSPPSHRRARSRSPIPVSLPLPSLIPDLSSESDESDSFIAPLLSELDVPPTNTNTKPVRIPHAPAPYFLNDPQLAFLPHSPIEEQRPRRKSRVGGGRRYKALRGRDIKCELIEKDEGCLAGF